ncbi:MAG: YkgJ family cysteine cluster protein [Parachlamydiales bacterium]
MNNSSLPVINSLPKAEEPWYKDGLRFECTGCGQCCTGAPGFVWVSEEDIKAMAAHLNLSIKEFRRGYLRRVGKRYSLLENPKTFDCIFLDGKKCEIYQLRPTQCRTFPWWPTQVKSQEEWDAAASYCEGISPKAPLIPREKIEEQLKLYEEKHPKEE